MSGTWWVLTLTLTAVALIVTGLIIGADITYRRDEIPLIQRTSAPQRTNTPRLHRHPAQQETWRPLWSHAAPPRLYDVPQAHEVMRRHRECGRDECPAKHTAYRVLVRAGHLTPPWPRSAPRPPRERPRHHDQR